MEILSNFDVFITGFVCGVILEALIVFGFMFFVY